MYENSYDSSFENVDDELETVGRHIYAFIRSRELYLEKLKINSLSNKDENINAIANSLQKRIESIRQKIMKLDENNNNTDDVENNKNKNLNDGKILVAQFNDDDDDDQDDNEMDQDSDDSFVIHINSGIVKNERQELKETESEDEDAEKLENQKLLSLTELTNNFQAASKKLNIYEKEIPCWERQWRNLTDLLNEIRTTRDDQRYLNYYTFILKLHIDNRIELSHKCREALFNCLDPSLINSLFDLDLMRPIELRPIISMIEQKLLFTTFKTNHFDLTSLNPVYLIMSLSVLMYKFNCLKHKKEIIDVINNDLALMINRNKYNQKFREIGVKCFIRAAILNGLFDANSLRNFLEITKKKSINNQMRYRDEENIDSDDDDDSDMDDDDNDDDDDDDLTVSESEIDSEIEFFNQHADDLDEYSSDEEEMRIIYAPRSPPNPENQQMAIARDIPAQPHNLLPAPGQRQVVPPPAPVQQPEAPVQPQPQPPVQTASKKSVADWIDPQNSLRNMSFPLSLQNITRIFIKNNMHFYCERNVMKFKLGDGSEIHDFLMFKPDIDSILNAYNKIKSKRGGEIQANLNHATRAGLTINII